MPGNSRANCRRLPADRAPSLSSTPVPRVSQFVGDPDLIIAPGFDPAALEMLRAKKKGGYLIFQIDADYEPPKIETRDEFDFRLQQKRNNACSVG